MLFIICLFSILVFSIFANIKGKQKEIVIALILFSLFFCSAFRDGTNLKDYENYVMSFYNIDTTLLIEPSFKFFSKLVQLILGYEVLYLFIIYSFLGLLLKYIALRQLSSLILVSLLLYVSNSFILHEMIQIRAGVCAAFLLLSIKPLYERKAFYFFLYAVLATLFHYSGVIIFFFWILNPLQLDIKKWGIIIPLGYLLVLLNYRFGNLLSFLPIPFIKEKIDIYVNGQAYSTEVAVNVFSIALFLRCVLISFLLYKKDQLLKHNKYVVILLKIDILAIFIFLVSSDINAFAFRINELLGIVEIVLFPCFIYLFKPYYLSRLIPVGYACLGLYMHVVGKTMYL